MDWVNFLLEFNNFLVKKLLNVIITVLGFIQLQINGAKNYFRKYDY